MYNNNQTEGRSLKIVWTILTSKRGLSSLKGQNGGSRTVSGSKEAMKVPKNFKDLRKLGVRNIAQPFPAGFFFHLHSLPIMGSCFPYYSPCLQKWVARQRSQTSLWYCARTFCAWLWNSLILRLYFNYLSYQNLDESRLSLTAGGHVHKEKEKKNRKKNFQWTFERRSRKRLTNTEGE